MRFVYQLQNWLQKKLREKTTVALFLGLIIIAGVFLRTYQHKNWLYFDDDQANDAIVVSNVIEGHNTWPLLGPNMGNTKFHLGPIFYYFQITSAKVFGNNPNALAYPDLFFSLLAIPLFYYFLRKYFSVALALPLTGLYTISYFAIKFSRFAWNTNSMPFFILLFLLALTDFLAKREKIKWFWAIMLGIAIGIGTQLHAMLLVAMPIMTVVIFLIVVIKNPKTFLKWLVVILIALFLNTGQIIHELNTGFKNTHYFFKNATERSNSGSNHFLKTLALDTACHIQANTYILTTLGNKDNCDFLKTRKKSSVSFWQQPKQIILNRLVYFGIILLSVAFSLLGYFLLIKKVKKEKDNEKEYFLRVIIFYLILFFVIMFPSIKEAPLRYFLPIFFLPYLFLGFIAQIFQKRYSSKYFILIGMIFVLIAGLNISYLASITRQLSQRDRSGTKDVILGEIETMRDYIINSSYPSQSAYLFGGSHYIFRFYRPLQYLAQKKNFLIQRTGRIEKMVKGNPVFYIYRSYPNRKITQIKNMPVLDYKNFGKVAVYKVIKKK